MEYKYEWRKCMIFCEHNCFHNGTSPSYADSLNKHDLLIERSSTGNSEDTGCRNHTRNCSQYTEENKAQTSQLVNADSKEPIQVSMCRQDMVNSAQKTSKHSSKATTSKDFGVELTNTSTREPVFNWRVNNKENEEPLDSRVGNKDLVRSKLQCRSYKHIVSGGALLRNGELPYELLNSGVDAYENNPDPSRDRDFQTKATTPLQHEHMKYLTNGGLLPKSEGGISNVKHGGLNAYEHLKHGDLIHAYENVKLQFSVDGSLPQYESHNVDQLYGNVKWDTSSVDSNLDQLYGNVTSNVDGNVRWNDETCDKHDRRGVDNVDRMFGEMKERERDKEDEEEEEPIPDDIQEKDVVSIIEEKKIRKKKKAKVDIKEIEEPVEIPEESVEEVKVEEKVTRVKKIKVKKGKVEKIDCDMTDVLAPRFIEKIQPVLKHGPRSLTCVRVVVFRAGAPSAPGASRD
uniref:Uncharacterized protein n=1 Tax=Cacopsylla melanoneura TaxID=428564 RepID=A0A8D8QZY4_9HEMI